jgi:excisionase family DNA binding protein
MGMRASHLKSNLDKEIEETEPLFGKERTAASNDILMTVNEVAIYIRCHVVSVYRLLKRKSIPAFKVGGNWRFSRREIDAWIAGPFETTPRRTKKSRSFES